MKVEKSTKGAILILVFKVCHNSLTNLIYLDGVFLFLLAHFSTFNVNKDEHAQIFALSGILLEREKERESFGILYIGYPLSIVKDERETEREKNQQIITKSKNDTYLLVK